MPTDGADAVRAAEKAARLSYGRLLAYLAKAWRDVAAAEDALADAFAAALTTWPRRGVPANPEAWLLVASRNRLRDAVKARTVRIEAVDTLVATARDMQDEMPAIPDRRLELMFVCAHPAIDPAVRTPLMLQTVLGLDAARIGSSFLVAPATMGQRLSRAKARIAAAGIRFEFPDGDELGPRAAAVREAIYAAYGTGWDGAGGSDPGRRGLTAEAIWLARVLVDVLRDDAEALGLLALMLYCESRRDARLVEGRYVPLAAQDATRWDRSMTHEAESLLAVAGAFGRPGRFQIEAAIQSAMVQSRLTGQPLAGPILSLHRSLVSFAPTIGNRVALAAALADARDASAGLAELDALDAGKIVSYQPYWAVRADLLARSRADAASIDAAYSRAIGLSDDEPVRVFLATRRADFAS